MAHSPDPVSTLLQHLGEREHVAHVVERGAAGRHLPRRQRLDVDVATRDTRRGTRRKRRISSDASHAQTRNRAGAAVPPRAGRRTPSAAIATRWKMHSGHGSSPSGLRVQRITRSSPKQATAASRLIARRLRAQRGESSARLQLRPASPGSLAARARRPRAACGGRPCHEPCRSRTRRCSWRDRRCAPASARPTSRPAHAGSLRGSSIMNVMHCRWIDSYSSSTMRSSPRHLQGRLRHPCAQRHRARRAPSRTPADPGA